MNLGPVLAVLISLAAIEPLQPTAPPPSVTATNPSASPNLALFLPPLEELSPLKADGESRRYTADNLWERINGEAEQFKRYGLVESAAADYADPSDAGRRLEIQLFLMATPLAAFGLYAAYRSPQDIDAGTGNNSVIRDGQAFFWHGRIFVLVQAVGPPQSRRYDLVRALQAINAELGPAPPRPEILACFERLSAPSAVQYLPDHLLGRTILPAGLEGKTASGLSFFASVPQRDEQRIIRAYSEVLTRVVPLPWGNGWGLSGMDPTAGPVTVMVSGGRLIGIRALPDQEGVKELLADLLNALDDCRE